MQALERLSFSRSLSRAPQHPSGLDNAVRYCLPSGLGEGYEDGFAIEDSCLLTTKQVKIREGFEETEPGAGRLVFVFHLSGGRTVEIPGASRHTLSLPCFVAYHHPAGVSKTNVWNRGGWDTGVTIGFDCDDPPSEVKQQLPALSQTIHTAFDENAEFTWFQSPLTPEMESVAGQLLAPNIHPNLLRDYMYAKSKELLVLGLDSILKDHQLRPESPGSIREKIKAAKAILDENTRDKIGIGLLAEELGIAPATLSKQFMETYGLTIHEYATERRMTKAVHMLVATDLSMKQIAYEVGYNHTSNFCLAFKRRFGVTARRARLEGRGAEPANDGVPG